MHVKDLLLGRALATEEADDERVGPLAGVPVLGLDALASAAYGPEALLTVLLPLGLHALDYTGVLTLSISLLLILVFVSYRQTIAAYPNGGGAYTVAKENLGTGASLFAAAALALDYLLNVAVAIASGVGALVSAVPSLLPHTLALCLLLLLLLTLINLRGVRATGLLFMLPTWLFVFCMLAMIAVGVVRAVTHGEHPPPIVPPHAARATLEAAPVWLLLRAFASGCTAMTGVEAVSNAVPIFRKPAVAGAERTLTLIIVILLVLLAGEAFLCHVYRVTATPPGQAGYQSVLSQLAAAMMGRGFLYYVTLASIVVVLGLSANTSFADFPRLCRMLAADGFLPEPLVHRGRRLAFSHGIVMLSVLSGALLVIFGGVTDGLIPLFAVGALLAFTMSQAGMVAHWRKRPGSAAKRALVLNATGMIATGIASIIVMVSKFEEGAFISLLIIAATLVLFRQVRRHYDFLGRVTKTEASLDIGIAQPPLVVVPIRRWDAIALKALRLGMRMASDVIAVQVLTRNRAVDELTERWNELAVAPTRALGLKPPALVVLPSEYRSLFTPLLDYVGKLEREHPDRQIVVVVPELIEKRWYHYFLHGHSASVMKAMLLLRGGPQTVVVTAPWYLKDWRPEQRLLRR